MVRMLYNFISLIAYAPRIVLEQKGRDEYIENPYQMDGFYT